MANLRDLGEHVVAHVEIEHPACQTLIGFVQRVPYHNLKQKGKIVAYDFYFRNTREIKRSLEKMLKEK